MKYVIFIWCLFLLFFWESKASNNEGLAPLIQNTDGRRIQMLDGHWKYMVDMYENGYYNYRKLPRIDGYFMDQKIQSPSDLLEYNFDDEQTLRVPGDWNTQDDKLFYYEGNIWYRRKFDVDKSANMRYFVYFGAVNYETHVYFNRVKLGVHEGGFTPFNFEVTDQVLKSGNSLILKVDNRRRPEGVPTDNTDWYNYGGITRSVKLIEVPETFIRDYHLVLDPSNCKLINGYVQLDGTQKQQNVHVVIPELKVDKVLRTDASGRADFSLSTKPQLWSPESPKLYRIIIRSESDEVQDQIGFRTIKAEGKKLILNGQEIFARGISIHEEAPFRSGRAWSEADAKVLIGLAKELNCNFVRLAHYPHNEAMVKEAERQGLLVWSEIPVYWTINWDNAATLANARNQLAEMIHRDKNRANIIIWSISNETPVSATRNLFLRTLIHDVKQLDSTRLVAMAMEVHSVDANTKTIGDPLADELDVLSFNQYVGWYDGLPDKCDRLNWTFTQNKPVFISEVGAGALQGLHGDANQRWTEEFQENLYIHNINMMKRMKGLAGVTPWILMDFRSPRRPLPGIQDGFNRKGLVSDQLIKKKAFFILQNWYNEIQSLNKK
ncbi:glycoside hydrolase family 2 protein [Geofilum sp. OHC36d9]|uniref:glycoside hydrolase family 2 protein n=1 Tax=Geofilum sp. OHC36d9 TaxID=3458413 RepID=UPI00403440E6